MSDDVNDETPVVHGIARRDALKAMAAAAMVPMLPTPSSATPAAPVPRTPLPMLDDAQQAKRKGPRGTPSDPVLQVAKADWPMRLQLRELATLTALCDMIIPADGKSPAASTVGAPAYINEWASRPGGDASLVRVRGGLAWLDRESNTRFGKRFHLATNAQRTAICDDICYLPKAKPEHQFAAQFFDTIRDQTATAFYTTPQGWKDLGYIGNVAIPKFEGPNAEIRRKIGLE
ncbi:gluconate 2-dehydrogenase subunit 3 family protein [Gemmatimonas sp.]|uniref:gluconate 2-dehydrogenase subunit 3 family protein n=1 Tax=Gemmatimonas sp. TaxID=1962908 RepID=UPI00286D326B|nr:gluconate 2-dehydrogenase subunit 3 family protein [Gemmatimonas sp.]